MENKTNCTICTTEINDIFCSKCGQKYSSKKLSVKTLFIDLISTTFSLERSIFSTLYKIITSPKLLINNYSKGYTGYYPSPGKVILYALTLAALHIAFIDDKILGISLTSNVFSPQITFWLIFIPLFSLTSFITFIKKKDFFAKHSISVLYLSSSFFIITLIINDILIIFFDNPLTFNILFLFLLFVFIWNAIVFTPSKKYLQILINVIIEIIVFVMIIIILFGLLYLISPESIQLM